MGNKHKLAGNILVEVHSRLTMMLSEKLFSRGYGNCEWTVAVNHGLSFRGLKKEAPFLPVPSTDEALNSEPKISDVPLMEGRLCQSLCIDHIEYLSSLKVCLV